MTVLCPSNGRSASSTSSLLALAAQTSAGRTACSCLPWPAVLPRRPHHPLLLPPLTRPCGDGNLTPTSEPSYSSPRGLPLPRLPRLRVVPFLGLAVIHHPGALGAVWSTLSKNGFHQSGLYVERLTAGSTATTQFFRDLPSKSLCQACWVANL